MGKQIRWLREQIERWKALGLISADQADGIQKLYPEPKAAPPWGTIIFSGIGAVVAGLGVILLVAYNWHAIPKFGKLAVIFGALIAAHGVGIWLSGRPDWRRQLGEAFCLLGSMMFGAGVWLVAQIYNIEEHYPHGFLIWGVGALAMAWALSSVAQGLLATAVLCVWGCSEVWGFQMAEHWAPVLILLGVGGLSWRLRSRVLLSFAMLGFLVALLSNASDLKVGLVVPVLLNTSVLFVAVGLLVGRQKGFPGSAPIWTFFGWAGSLLSIYMLSFGDEVRYLLGWYSGPQYDADQPAFIIYCWAPFGLALAAWGVMAWRCRPGLPAQERITDCAFGNWLLPFTAILAQVTAARGGVVEGWGPPAAAFNMVFLALAAMWMARGCREGILRETLLGSLLLVALAVARYFDLFESLAARGLVFLVVGGALFVEGLLYRRARRGAADAEGKA